MSDRYLGGFITTVPPDPDPALGNAAPGMWTMEQYFALQKQGKWPGTDPYFNQTVLSLHGNGSSGDNNNTFLDSGTANSGSGFTITRNGNTTQGTFSPFSLPDGRWSNYFDGTSDYIETPSSSAFQFGTGAFTTECWFYTNRLPVSTAIFQIINFTDDKENISLTSGGLISYWNGSTGYNSTATYSVGTWHHVALVRESTSSDATKVYLDGDLIITATSSTNYSSNRTLVLGARAASTKGANCLDGYLSNVRVAKSAIYTSAFTPSIEPLTTTSQSATNVVLLTCQSSRFVDNSASPLSLTIAGNTKVTPFSPFAPTAAYDASVNGGSGYFDGSGDNLTVPATTAWVCAGDYAIEAWVYIPSLATDMHVLGTGGPGADDQMVVEGDGQFYWDGQGSPVGSVKAGMWNHLLATRSGTVFRGFINGVLQTYNASVSGTVGQNLTMYIGERNNGTNDFSGYISNIRYINGSVPTDYQTSETTVGTSVFSPPTSPFTATSQGATSGDVKLLLNYTNAGIFDNTGKNVLETVGNAQVDTSTVKFGAGSMKFDGTGDVLYVLGNPELCAFGTGDFTIEMWFYLNSFANTYNALYDSRPVSTQGNYPNISVQSNGKIYYYVNSAERIQSSTGEISTSQWYHLAVARSGTDTKMFINGSQVGSTYSDSTNYLNVTSRPAIGAEGFNSPPNDTINGLIDDLRITKGVARYTSNFTPQTSQWQDK